MKAHLTKILFMPAFLVLVFGSAQPAYAALYPGLGVRANTISVCFVGNAVTVRPDRVQQILTYIKEFEYAANIHFNYLGSCPDPIVLPNGKEYYDGDIRVVIPSTSVSGQGPPPGVGCTAFRDGNGNYNGQNEGWGSWSNFPADLPINRSCLYNMKLGDDPWTSTPYLNHTLHEFGHALGLAHEHERKDSTCYNPSKDARHIAQGYMTPYDPQSVMNYQFRKSQGDTCDINGNYGFTGFSDWDRLALHILYPEYDFIAEYVGTTVVRINSVLHLQSSWEARGAKINFVAKNFVWKLSGSTVSTMPDLNQNMGRAGSYGLQFSYSDFLGRNYSYQGTVRVLEPAIYDQQVVAPTAATSVMLV